MADQITEALLAVLMLPFLPLLAFFEGLATWGSVTGWW